MSTLTERDEKAPSRVKKREKRSRIEYGAPPRADLLPASERTRRETRALTRRWIRVALLALVIAALIVGAAFVLQMRADSKLEEQQERTDELMLELAQYQDIASAVAAERTLLQRRAAAMATDIVWSDLLTAFESVLPGAATIEAMRLAPGAAPGSVNKLGLVGIIDVESPNPLDLAAIIVRLTALDPVVDASMKLLEGPDDDGNYRYTVTVELDQSIYSGQFEEAQ